MTEAEAPRRTGRFVWRSTYSRYQMQRLSPERQRELHAHDLAMKFGDAVIRRIADGRRYVVRIETRENHVDDLVEAANALNGPLGLRPALEPTPDSIGFDIFQSTAYIVLADPYEAEVGDVVAHDGFLRLGMTGLKPATVELHLEPRHRLADGQYLPSTTMALLKFQRESDDVWRRVA